MRNGRVLDDALWLRQEWESAKGYEAFLAYRDLGPSRTLRQVAEKCGLGRRTVEGWSTKYRWSMRCQAWADHQEAESRREQLEALHDMNRRHIAVAQMMQARAIDKLNSLSGSASLTPTEALRFIEVGVRLERLARGEPTDVSEHRIDAGTRAGRMSRAVLESPEALEKALDVLDLVAG